MGLDPLAVICLSVVLLAGAASVAGAAPAAGSSAILFAEDFEAHPAGARLSAGKPQTGGGYADLGTTVVVEAGATGAPAASARGGSKCARMEANSDRLLLAPEARAAARGQTVRFTFDLYLVRPPECGAGGADIQTFEDSSPEASRAFNLLLGNDGSISYYVGANRVVPGKIPAGAWVPVEVVADYKAHVFRATVGDVAFDGRFDTRADGFSQVYFGKFGSPIYYYDNVRVELAPQLAGTLPVPVDASDLGAPAACPYDVGDRAQLFIDRLLVRDTERVWFTQHQGRKHPGNPLLRADQPWEGWRLEIFGNVLYDEEERLFKMWYLPEPGGAGGYFDDPNVTCYATSTDGIHWQKPLVGTLPSRNGKPHNAVAHVHQASVIKDSRDPDPERRYKMIGWSTEPPGYNTFVSPDGLHWKLFSQQPIAPGGDVMTGFWDPGRQLYVAFPKQNPTWRSHSRRLFGTIASRDFVHWSEPALSWTTDERDDLGSLARIEQVRPILDRPDDPRLMRTEYYGIGAYPAESCTIGFPWVLTVNNGARWGNDEGPEEIQLAVSRDLIHWERPFRTPVIAIGELNQWDASYHTCAATAIRVGDEIRLYYAGANYTHGTPCLYRTEFEDGQPTGRKTRYTSSIGLVTWELDRFVSVDAPAEGGTLATVPIRFSGSRLEINAATKGRGRVVVEVCDAAGRRLRKLPLSDAFRGDDVRHVVTFRGRRDLSALAGQPISLRFRLSNAELYSFAFRR